MYKVAVKIEGIEKRKKSTGVLHVLAGLFLLIATGTLVKYEAFSGYTQVVLLYAAALLSFIYGLFRKRIDPVAKQNHWVRLAQFVAFAVIGISLLNKAGTVSIISYFLWAVVVVFLMFTERKVFHDTDILIKKEGIYIPGYFTNHQLPWHIISEFIIRQDFVTITRQNKTYVQLELLQKIEQQEINKINEFAANQITQQVAEVKV
jgi:hypothetical protein